MRGQWCSKRILYIVGARQKETPSQVQSRPEECLLIRSDLVGIMADLLKEIGKVDDLIWRRVP
jgi:hypothetical protein